MIRVTFTDGSVREYAADGVDESTLRDQVVRLYTKRDEGKGVCDQTAAFVYGQQVRCIEVVPDKSIAFDLDCKIEHEQAVADAIKSVRDKLDGLRTASEMAAALPPEPVTPKAPGLTKTNGEIIAERVFTLTPGKAWVGVNEPDTGKGRDTIYMGDEKTAASLAKFLRSEFATAIDAATAVEREACAAIADRVGRSGDGVPPSFYDAASRIASAIRFNQPK